MIFVSAGHYPAAPGARFERFVEHDEAVVWANELVDLLNQKVRPPEDHIAAYVPTGVLKAKVDFINSRTMNGDLAIEIHFNAAKDSNGKNVGSGSETLYMPGDDSSKAIAALCQSVLGEVFAPNRGIKEGWYRMDPSKGADFFLSKTLCPSAILEPEFIHRFELIQARKKETISKLADKLSGYHYGEWEN